MNIKKDDFMKSIFGKFGLIKTIGKYLPKVTIEAPDRKLVSLPINKKSRNEVLEILKNKEYIKQQKESERLKRENTLINDSNAEIIIKVKAVKNQNGLNESKGISDMK